MIYNHSVAHSWHGVLADGVFDMNKVAGHMQYPNGQIKHPDMAILEAIGCIRRSMRSKPPRGAEVHPAGRLYCERLSEGIYRVPVCETYLLSPNTKKDSAYPTKKHISTIREELRDSQKDRFAVVVLSNCKDVVECNKRMLEEIGFNPWPKAEYHNHRKFSNAAKNLIEDSATFFEAPCCRLYEYLQQQKLVGLHDTF